MVKDNFCFLLLSVFFKLTTSLFSDRCVLCIKILLQCNISKITSITSNYSITDVTTVHIVHTSQKHNSYAQHSESPWHQERGDVTGDASVK